MSQGSCAAGAPTISMRGLPLRALSFAGVEYEILRHELTADQIEVYDTYADAWSIIHRNMEQALELTGVVDAGGDTLNSGAKAAARSRFESCKQRFFGAVLLSCKLPTVIAAVRQHLQAGQSVVLQLVSTAEAILDRRLGELSPDERAELDLDLSPREFLLSGSPDNTASLQSRFMSSGSRAGADLRDEDIGFTPDN
nr:hypothetical protein [Rhizorhabdus sp.]